MNCNCPVKNQIDEILEERVNLNLSVYWDLVAKLTWTFRESGTVECLEYMYENSFGLLNYKAIAYIIEESGIIDDKKGWDNKQQLFEFVKKMLALNNFRITYPLLRFFSKNIKSTQDMNILVDFIFNRNVAVCAKAMECISYVLDKEQVVTLNKSLIENFTLDDIFDDHDESFYNKIFFSTESLQLKILLFCSAVRSKLSKKYLEFLVESVSCEEISEFFYVYVLDMPEN